MKKVMVMSLIMALSISGLLISCSDDSHHSNPVYDLRSLSRLIEEYQTTPPSDTDNGIRMPRKRGHRDIVMEAEQAAARRWEASLSAAAVYQKTFAYEYEGVAHLYWTETTGKDSGGAIIATATQVLDDGGFPVRAIWYDGSGNFQVAYDYEYDSTLFLQTSVICYLDNPSDTSEPRRDYEKTSTWNDEGIFTNGTGVDYDENGMKASEYKWRSTTIQNALRGAGGLGYDDYYREYKNGVLTYQEETAFDADGYPKTYKVDNNGDGTFEEMYSSEIEKTAEGYLASVLWIEDGTGHETWKETFEYDAEGLLNRSRDYQMVNGQWVLERVVTDVWYRNPVNGPTGGINVYFESDEEGNPLGEYETIEWAATQKIIHHYFSPGEEAYRITDSLEKIRVR
jgi:hypothetical protein